MHTPEYKRLIRAWYTTNDSLYHVLWKELYGQDEIESTFADFNSFYEFAYLKVGFGSDKPNHKINGFVADLLNCPCEGALPYQIQHLDMLVSSSVQQRLCVYDAGFETAVKPGSSSLAITLADESSFQPPVPQGGVLDTIPDITNTENVVFYLSDLHLDHKIALRFPGRINDSELTGYFLSIADDFKKAMDVDALEFLIIVGDVSFNYKVLRLFLRVIFKALLKPIFFILGNHELWDHTLWGKGNTLDEVVEWVRKDLSFAGITLLENDLYFPFKYSNPKINSIYHENDIQSLSDEDLRGLFKYSGIAILGGMGFAGYNVSTNADTKMYSDAPVTREMEIERSKRFEALHERLKRVVPNNRSIIVATHTPYYDWTDKRMQPNWWYLSGHTHENKRIDEDGCHFIADCQIGYRNEVIKPRFFSIVNQADIFEDKPDGQYDITQEEYELFYSTLWLGGGTKRRFARIIMLKRQGNYMFFGVNEEGYLYILNGGQIRSTYGHDLDYYYERMPVYAASVNAFLAGYTESQIAIASEVRKLGGRGTIHGCIIDLDPPGTPFSYNHLYLNPIDGTLTPYYALAMNDKYVYKNVPSLLHEKLPAMYERLGLLTSTDALLPAERGMDVSSETQPVINTEIYKVSRIIKSLQYTKNYNVIRIWSYALADAVSSESGRLIVAGMVDPDSLPQPNKKPFQMTQGINMTKPTKVSKGSKKKPKEHSEASFRRMILKYVKQRCELLSGGNTSIVAMKGGCVVECKCRICGNVWVGKVANQPYECPNCHKGLAKNN